MTDIHEKYDRRNSDRRLRIRPSLKYLILGGRRASFRRDSDRYESVFVDRYSNWLLVLIAILLFLNLADGFLTLYLVEHGATEINPIMEYFINMGPWPFMAAKFLFTCFGLLCLLVLQNMYFKPLGVHVKKIFPVFIAIFIIILGWQIFLTVIKDAI
jgi:Domain of unknown function (DUF5658)